MTTLLKNQLLLLDNREEVIKSIFKEVNFCSECENNLRNSDLSVYTQQIIRMTNKLLKTSKLKNYYMLV